MKFLDGVKYENRKIPERRLKVLKALPDIYNASDKQRDIHDIRWTFIKLRIADKRNSRLTEIDKFLPVIAALNRRVFAQLKSISNGDVKLTLN